MISYSHSTLSPQQQDLCIAVDSLVVSAGERFSFVVTADQQEDCYWVRFRGMGDCDPTKSSTHGEAFLCYNGSVTEPLDSPTYEQGRRPGRVRYCNYCFHLQIRSVLE